jgi:hypothetical protein
MKDMINYLQKLNHRHFQRGKRFKANGKRISLTDPIAAKPHDIKLCIYFFYIKMGRLDCLGSLFKG